jgi:hypothetical protein
MRLHKKKIRFLPIMHISVWTEASVLNYVSFLILYYALFTSKSPLFLVWDFINILVFYGAEASMDEKVAQAPYSSVSIFVNLAVQVFDLL